MHCSKQCLGPGVPLDAGRNTSAAFKEARVHLQHNRYAESDNLMSSYIKKNLGSFQYLSDLAIVYSPDPIQWNNQHPEIVAAEAAKSPPVSG
jgi:hypothetical protein